jgi:2-iminobutanoate/2-iminopropanoate deaminase
MTLQRFALLALLVIGVGSVAGPAAQTRQDPEFINLVEPWPYPFSSAVRTGNLIFLSGQIGSQVVDGAPKLVAGGIEAETKQALENIKAILAKSGSSMDRVVKCSVMMADMAEWPRMNTIYATYFTGRKPARSAWGATGLALNARVEIECMALHN